MSKEIQLKNNMYWNGGSVKYRTSDLILDTPSTSSDDSRDIVFNYGNGNEKARLWCNNDISTSDGDSRLHFRSKDSSGNMIQNGTIMLKQDLIFEKHDNSVTVPGNSLNSYNLDTITIPSGYMVLGILPRMNGYGDQWLVSLSYYSNKVVAMIHSKYSSSLTNTISYFVIFIKTNWFN